MKPSKFMVDNLPKVAVSDFMKENLPKFDPGYTLGPPVQGKGTHEKNLLEFYFNNDVRQIEADIHGRPDHYTQEQKEIVEALSKKRPLPPGTTDAAVSEIVLRYMERTEHRQKREQIIQKAQAKIERNEDPTIERMLEEVKSNPTFEDQASMPKAIKII